MGDRVDRRMERGPLEVVGRYKGMSQCATRLVKWSGIREASPRRPAPAYGPRTRRRYTPTPAVLCPSPGLGGDQ